MKRPRQPRDGAPPAQWDRYRELMAAWESEQPPRWQSGGRVDGQPARTRQRGERTEALWGGDRSRGDGIDHGHLVSNDGVNASYVRYPGEEPIVDDQRKGYDYGSYGQGRYDGRS